MLDWLYALVARLPFWPTLAAALVAALLCNGGFAWRSKAVAPDLLDGRRRGYTIEEAQELFDRLHQQGTLRTYAWTQVTLDLVYPAAYGLLFSLLLVRLYRPEEALVLFFPVAGVATDLVENLSVAVLALTHGDGDKLPRVVTLLSDVTIMKCSLIILALLSILFGAARKAIAPTA